jgi:Beta protein
MIKYVPFLKLKGNEIMAVKELDADLRQTLTPFFDFPYMKERTEESFKKTARRMFRSINRHLKDIPYFYLDNYDVNSSLTVDGNNSYAYLLSIFEDLSVVPVISIDRSDDHMQAVCEAKDSGDLKSNLIALRFVAEYFESFDVVAGDIEGRLGDTFRRFDNVDLILDCRVCLNQNLDSLTSSIKLFIQNFIDVYSVNKIIVTGSSISASIGDILETHHEVELHRVELDVFDGVYDEIGNNFNVVLGDYGIVSPNYSDISIPPEAMLNVLAPKIIYTFDRQHYIIRGGAIRTHERGFLQYNDLAAKIITKPFYRGADYSFGDNYIEEKSRSVGNNVMPSTIIKPTVNLHITYMLNDYV